MNQEQIHLLLLDDDDYYRRSMAATLRNLFGFLVDEAVDERSAMDQMAAAKNRYDVVLIDQRLADDRDGVSVMADIRRTYPEIECIILTGYAPEDRERALTAGAFRYVEKLFVNHNELSLLIRAAVQQARMRALGRDILSRLEQDDILHRALSAARMFETDNTAIALYDPESARWDWFRQLTSSDELDRSPFPAGDQLADGIYRDRCPVIVSDLQAHPDYAALAQQGVLSLAAVPVSDADRPLGILLACSDYPNHYNAERLSWLNELAVNAGMALENARTYRQTKDLAKYMAALTAISLKLTQTTEQSKLLRLVWEFVDKELNVATFFVALYDRETDEVAYPIVWDEGESKEVPTFKLADDNGLTAHVIRIGEGRYWPTIDEKERYCKAKEITLHRSERSGHSCLLFPLLAGGRVIGAMSVQSYKDYAFSYEFRTVFQALSNQLAAALENVSLIGEVSRRADDLETLQALSTDIASSLEIDVVGTRICEAAVDLFKANHSGLLLFGEGDKMGRVVAEYPPANALGKEVPIEGVPDEQSLIRGGKPLVIECVEERKELGPVRAILRDLGIQATLIAPVIAAGRLLGSFSIDYDHRRPFSKKDVENARMSAAQVAVALDHAHHYESATRNASQVRLLHTISDLIQIQTISENEQDDIFHMVLTGITAGFGLRFNAAALFLLNDNEFVGRLGIGHFVKKEAEVDWLRDEEQARNKFDHYHERLRRGEFRKERTPLDRAVRGTHWPNGGAGLLFDALRKSQASVIEVAERRDLPQQFIDAFQPAFPLAIAPLTARGQVIGFLAADNRFTDQPLNQDLQDSLMGYASTTAVAIHNFNQNKELELTQATFIAGKLLFVINIDTNDWRHRVRNYAQTILDQVELLEQDLERPPETRRRTLAERLQIINQRAEDIKQKPVVEPLDSANVQEEKANKLLREAAYKIVESMRGRSGENNPPEILERYEAGEDDCIAVNPAWFVKVVENILENAFHYVRFSSLPRIEIGTRRERNTVEMYFTDNGRGIPPDRIERVTKLPIVKDPDEPGHGIGLFLARLVMETYGGTIHAENNDPHGATITISFPIISVTAPTE